MHTVHGADGTVADPAARAASRHETRGLHRRARAFRATGLAALLPAGVLGAALPSVAAAPERRNPKVPPPTVAATGGSECLIGGSAVAGSCVVTSQQPVLEIPGSGNVYIIDGSSPDPNNAWISPDITLSPSSACAAAALVTRSQQRPVCCRATPTRAPSRPSPIPPRGQHPC
jgi:hypothetical protein